MEPKPSVLIVEDDDALRDALCVTLEGAGHRVTGVADGPAALERIGRNAYGLVLSDLRMQPMDGIELLAAIRARMPQLPVLLMTAFGEVDKAVQAMRAGACDFLLKPFEPSTLIELVGRYGLPPAAGDRVIAEDPATRQLLALAARVARTDTTVMLTGESGTGKEVIARYIHLQSARRDAPFVAINCAAIPDNLLEATLFGYEKGAFTGAQSAQPGKFEQAEGGTLLLDEISEMPLGLQAKLLRVLQEREVDRVGGRKPVALDIRVLATSNRDMAAEVRNGRFREDLYYRLNVFPIAIPPLRERTADIAPLARHCLSALAARSGRRAQLSAGALALLGAHHWPGNVRELENTLQRALILAPGETVEPEHLVLPPPASPMGESSAGAVIATRGAATPIETLAPSMREVERSHILETLAAVGGSRKRAVELLGISERTLRYKLRQYREEGAMS
jgi:two-component system response regulator FlrC